MLRNNESIKNNQKVERFETVRVNKNGRHMDVEVAMSPVKDAVGEVIGISIIARDTTLRREAEEARRESEELRRLKEARNELVRRIVNTQEDERGRISRELHNNLGQHLTALLRGLQLLEDQIQEVLGGRGQKEIPRPERLRSQIDELMRAAHREAWEMRAVELDAMGLEAALKQYVKEWSCQIGLELDFQPSNWEKRPRQEIETTLYHVVQEALTNVARQAGATQVSVIINMDEANICAIIEDNGCGFDTKQSTGRLGVLGMRERGPCRRHSRYRINAPRRHHGFRPCAAKR